MEIVYTFIITSICFAFFLYARWLWSINQARRNGLYPDKGKATLFDVRRLILKKEKSLAIRVYSEIYGTSFKKAKKAVEEIEKSIQEKNIELE